MNNTEQIYTAKATIDELYRYNEQVYYESCRKDSVGYEYSTPYFSIPEKYQKKDPWEYKINRYGFRGKEWTFEKTPALFGCSCTFGIGVRKPSTELLQNKLDTSTIPNLGIPGGSIVNIIKLFSAFTKLHPVSEAFIIIPPVSRVFVPLYSNEKQWTHHNYLPNFTPIDKKQHKAVYKVFSNEVSQSYACDYIEWANYIAKARNIQIHWGTWCKYTYNDFLIDVVESPFFWDIRSSGARDGSHPGIEAHERLADQCVSLLGL